MAKKKKAAKESETIFPPEETDPSLKRPETVEITDRKGNLIEVSTKPKDLGDFKGSYKHKLYKDPFSLKVVEDDTHGRTHHLKNNDHYWAGTEEEFKAQFEKN
jgi:hypothetical protein